jgi:phosphoserine phosphatase RsbU/P
VASLVAVEGPASGKQYSLEEECVLGRSFNSDIVIGDLNVSRRHARIHKGIDGAFMIEDLGSGNGTFVNDEQVSQHRLVPRDVIRIGGSSFRYEPDAKSKWRPEVMTVLADVSDYVDHDTGRFKVSPKVDKSLVQEDARSIAAVPADRAPKMLQAMYAVADAIGSELELSRLMDKILSYLFEVFSQADRGIVLLVHPESGELVPEAVKQRSGRSGEGFSLSMTMVQQVLERGTGMIKGNTDPGVSPLSPYVTSETDKYALEDGAAPVPRMATPLICGKQVLGTLSLEGVSAGAPFSREDLDLLSAIARQAAVAIANARAGQELLKQHRLDNDLRLARQIQESFLPQHLPQIAGIEFQAHYKPALHVGGDFYDIIRIDKSKIGLIVGDISGKGVSAALMMAKLTTDIRLLSRTYSEPADVLTHANRSLLEAGQDAMFATVIYLLLDLKQGTFTVSNAGHQPPMVASRRAEGVTELDDATAVALGVVPELVYPQQAYKLIAGDVVLLYTDGLNEATNRQRQEYGMNRLRHVVTGCPPAPSQLVQRLVADVQRFVGGAAQSDDLTLLAFGVTE